MKKGAQKLWISTGIFVFFFLCLNHANATIVFQQTDSSSGITEQFGGSSATDIFLGTSTQTFIPSSVLIKLNTAATSTYFAIANQNGVQCDSNKTGFWGANFNQFSCYGGGGTIHTGDPIYLQISGTYGIPGNYFTVASNVAGMPYVQISDNNTDFSGYTSLPYWVEPYTPYNGAYASTSPTVFSASYYNPDSTQYDTLTFEITDLSGNSVPTISTSPITSSGINTETQSIVLNPGDSYLWRPEAYLSTNPNETLYGNWYNFVASSSVPITINTAYNATLGTSTVLSTTNLLSFLDVPVLLQTKVPFAYIFQIRDGIYEGISSSSTNAIPSGNFVWSGIGTGTTTFDFFSTTTVGYYLSPTLIGLWRAFLLVVLYVGFGFSLYNIARKQLHI